MTAGPPDPTGRFSDRVDDYRKSRPAYPPALLDALEGQCGIRPGATLVEVGAGTGILTAQLLDRGYSVIAVEPNRAMAAAAVEALGERSGFRLVRASAEAAALSAGSADAYVAAQAFHWFDAEAAAAEARRILRPPAPAALVWNMRRLEASPFLRAYEALLRRWSTDYAEVSARYMHDEALRSFFRGPWQHAAFDNSQLFDYAGLEGRLLSSSYSPPQGHPSRAPMLEALRRLFDEHARDGHVAFEYDTELVWSKLGG